MIESSSFFYARKTEVFFVWLALLGVKMSLKFGGVASGSLCIDTLELPYDFWSYFFD